MENIAYKNRNKEINDVINFIFDKKHQIFLYESKQGYGNTAFMNRIEFLLQKTPTVEFFSAELSPSENNPLHTITKKISCKDNRLYKRLQLFTDNSYGNYEMPLLPAILKDLSQSDTLATLFQTKSSLPIYAGFYQDRLKEIVFILIDEITKLKKVVIYIDNIQYIDNESIYELQALIRNPNVKFICCKTGTSSNFEKFYYETKYKFEYIELLFPIPDTNYVKKLGEIYHKQLTNDEAETILYQANKDIRKILYYLRKPVKKYLINSIEQQVLKIINLYNDFINEQMICKILNFSPYRNIFPFDSLNDILINLETKGYLQSLIAFESGQKSYKVISENIINIDVADHLVLSKTFLKYYKQEENISYKHLLQAWDFANYLEDKYNINFFSVSIIKEALKMGYIVNDNILNIVLSIHDDNTQILLATYLFCRTRYKQAKNILDRFIRKNNIHRSIKVMYAIILNRCREHSLAQIQLKSLIKTSQDIDELTILLSFLISNHIHNNKADEAVNIYEKYKLQIATSKKYPYFLRNAATLFEPHKAYQIRNTAKELFKKYNDLFGYYSTIINMTSYNLKNVSTSYAISQTLMAFEGLQQFNASQLHLASNNLGICYLIDDNYIEATKYFLLSQNNAKTIMPIAYSTFNLAAMYIKRGENKSAYDLIYGLERKVLSSNLPRLKGKLFLYIAIIEYVLGNYEKAYSACENVIKYSNSALNTSSYKIVNQLTQNMDKSYSYTPDLWNKIYSPCFLEYWTINSIEILNDNFLTL